MKSLRSLLDDFPYTNAIAVGTGTACVTIILYSVYRIATGTIGSGPTIVISVAVAILLLSVLTFLRDFPRFQNLGPKEKNEHSVSPPDDMTSWSSRKSPPNIKLDINTTSIIWLEREMKLLYREMFSSDSIPKIPHFLQRFPNAFLDKDSLTPADVEELAIELVRQTTRRIGKLEVPFRKPIVKFTSRLPGSDPGYIEFGWNETLIYIHPLYKDDPFAVAAILCHEIAHFILDHNGLRKNLTEENEKFTDLFVFMCGQGLIYLQGVLDLVESNGDLVETKLGYLSLAEMAYAHVRCASHFDSKKEEILPSYYRGRQFNQVASAINFLSLNNGKRDLADVVICPNNHVLRIAREKKTGFVRCPKCNWQTKASVTKQERVAKLLDDGMLAFDRGDYSTALELFRKAQVAEKTNSKAYCMASRCLKKLGQRQDAIRELRKLLIVVPNDDEATAEMQSLL